MTGDSIHDLLLSERNKVQLLFYPVWSCEGKDQLRCIGDYSPAINAVCVCEKERSIYVYGARRWVRKDTVWVSFMYPSIENVWVLKYSHCGAEVDVICIYIMWKTKVWLYNSFIFDHSHEHLKCAGYVDFHIGTSVQALASN